MDRTQLSQEVTQLHAHICSAIADPNRILLLYALAERPRTVNDLSDEVGTNQPASHLPESHDIARGWSGGIGAPGDERGIPPGRYALDRRIELAPFSTPRPAVI